MRSKYIKPSTLEKIIYDVGERILTIDGDKEREAVLDFFKTIVKEWKNAPAVELPRAGYWEEKTVSLVKHICCSGCGRYANKRYAYCPYCGRIMAKYSPREEREIKCLKEAYRKKHADT